MTAINNEILKAVQDVLHRIETDVTNQKLIEEIRKLSTGQTDILNRMDAEFESIDNILKAVTKALEEGNVLLAAIVKAMQTAPPPEPPPPPIVPDLPFVTVRDKTPLMEVSNYDKKGKIVLRLHKYGLLKRGRIRAKAGKRLYYVGKVRTAQGIAYRLYSGQEVDGKWLTATNTKASISGTRNPKRIDKYFYILKTKVRV